MKGWDVRGVLNYVPQFAGRVFVIVFDEGLLPEPAVAETLLDLLTLQRIGVKLVVMVRGDLADFAEWAIETEFRSEVVSDLGALQSTGGSASVVARSREILSRGQAALVPLNTESSLSAEVGELASSLGAAKLMVLLREGEPRREGKPIPAIHVREVAEVCRRDYCERGDLLLRAAEICATGVPRVHLLDGKLQGTLVSEIFSNEGVGTMVHTDSYIELRPLREEDIAELLAMVGRSVRNAFLVPRNYEEVAARLGDYLALTLDGNVVGSVALHVYEEEMVGEVACLYVKHHHEGRGYGRQLVEAAEAAAAERGLSRVLALTNRAEGFFTQALGYQVGTRADLPAGRRRQLEESGRDSVVLWKDLTR